MTDYSKHIKEHMPVVGTDGSELGLVDHLDGENSIKLTRDENGNHHWIPIGWVTGVEANRVTINRAVNHAREEWSDSNPEEL